MRQPQQQQQQNAANSSSSSSSSTTATTKNPALYSLQDLGVLEIISGGSSSGPVVVSRGNANVMALHDRIGELQQ